MKEFKDSRGFTIVETMVALAILSILVTIARVSYERYIHKSRMAQVEGFAAQFEIYEMSRASADGVWRLQDLTGSACSACGYFGSTASPADPTIVTLWHKLGYDEVPTDGWGNAYLVDENEGEFGPGDCRPDVVISGGADGIQQTANGANFYTPGGDDLYYTFKHQRNVACGGTIIW